MSNADYILTCTLSLWLVVMFSGDAYRTLLFSEQDDLDQKIGTGGKEVLVILSSMKSAISHFVYSFARRSLILPLLTAITEAQTCGCHG